MWVSDIFCYLACKKKKRWLVCLLHLITLFFVFCLVFLFPFLYFNTQIYAKVLIKEAHWLANGKLVLINNGDVILLKEYLWLKSWVRGWQVIWRLVQNEWTKQCLLKLTHFLYKIDHEAGLGHYGNVIITRSATLCRCSVYYHLIRLWYFQIINFMAFTCNWNRGRHRELDRTSLL